MPTTAELLGIDVEVNGANEAAAGVDRITESTGKLEEKSQELSDRESDHAEKAKKEHEEYERDILKLAQAMDPLIGKTVAFMQSLEKEPKMAVAEVAIEAFHKVKEVIGEAIEIAVEGAKEYEQLGITMAGVFGKDRADDMLKFGEELQDKFAIPLSGVLDRFKMLKAYNLADGDLEANFQKIGDTAAATGANFDAIVRVLGMMQERGGVTFRNINQLMLQGIDVNKAFSEGLGISAEQMKDIDKLGLDGAKVSAALIEQLGTQYEGAMSARANTTTGLIFQMGELIADSLRNIANDGPWEAYTQNLEAAKMEMQDVFESEEWKNAAKAIADDFTAALETTKNMIEGSGKALRDLAIDYKVFKDAVSGSPATILPGGIANPLSEGFWRTYFAFDVADAEKQASSALDFSKSVHEKKKEDIEDLWKEADKIEKEYYAEEHKTWQDFQDKKSKAEKEAEKELEKEWSERDKEVEAYYRTEEENQRRADELDKISREEKKARDDDEKRQQKEVLKDQLTEYEAGVNAYKKQLEEKATAEKLFWDYRSAQAVESFRREQEEAYTTMRRGQEDIYTGRQRQDQELMNVVADIKRGDIFSQLPDELVKAMNATQVGIGDILDPRGHGEEKIRQYLDDQDKMVKRQQEDADKKFRQQQEDDLKAKELERKQAELSREQNTKAMIELATTMKLLAAKKEFEHMIKIIDSGNLAEKLMNLALQESKVRAKVEGQRISAP